MSELTPANALKPRVPTNLFPVTLRAVVDGDLSQLSRIAREAKGAWGYPPKWLDAWETDLTITRADLASMEIVVAEAGAGAQDGDPRTIVGFAAFVLRSDDWSLEHCWVSPSFMRRGVGRALYQTVVERISRQGGGTLTIVSDPHAVAFYEQLGAVRSCEVAAPMPGAPERRLPVLVQLIQPMG